MDNVMIENSVRYFCVYQMECRNTERIQIELS